MGSCSHGTDDLCLEIVFASEVEIEALGLEFGPNEIWATRLTFAPWDWNFGLKDRICN